MAATRRFLRSGVTTALVLLLGVIGSLVAFSLSNASLRHEDQLLLRQDAVQGSMLLSSFITQTPASLDQLGATTPASSAPDASWTAAARAVVEHGRYSGLALLRVEGGRLVEVASVGTVHRTFGSPDDDALVTALNDKDTPYASSVSDGGRRWLGTMVGSPVTPAGVALYYESALSSKPFDLSSLPGHPFSGIDAALYVGREVPQDLVLTTTDSLPLTGDRAVSKISDSASLMGTGAISSTQVGAVDNPGDYILVERANAPLSGRASAMLPWVLLGGGLLASVLVTGLLLLSERRRDHALQVVALLEQRNHELDEAVAHQQRTDARFAAMVRSSSDLTTVVDADDAVSYQSPSSLQLLGADPVQVVGTCFSDLLHGEDRATWTRCRSRLALEPGSELTVEWRLRTAEGGFVHVESRLTNLLEDPAVHGIVLNSRDVSDRMHLEEELRRQAFHDSLTGLANRALFQDRLEHALTRLSRTGGVIGVLFLDLDNFKAVNDGRGHGVGDELLRAVTGRLRNTVRAGDTLARLGGDEFAVLVEGTDHQGASETGDRILEALRVPFALAGGEVTVRASVGVVTTEDPNVTAEELLRNADIAMYAAKNAGKGRCETFHAGLHEKVINRLQLEADLGRAVGAEQLTVLYQPIVDLGTGQVNGVESLMRWRHPHRGLVMPGEFIPVAESTGLIVPMGRWLLRRACRDVRSIQEETEHFGLHLAVNLSARQLDDPDLVDDVEAALTESGLFPSLLTLEITESVFMSHPDTSLGVLTRLKELGVKLSIDDFGTGYSSLSYLQRLPVDELKIDRSFVAAADDESAESNSLVSTIVRLASDFGLGTVAEGIETEAQMQRLRDAGCRLAQGFLFAKPVDLRQLRQVMAVQEESAHAHQVDHEHQRVVGGDARTRGL